jgi:hypothetical protein
VTTKWLACLRFDRRYNGPPDSANGGYACGLMAEAISQRSGQRDGQDIAVRLHHPPPLDTDLDLVFDTVSNKWHLLQGELLIAAAHSAHVHAHLPAHVPDYVQALDASVHFSGHAQHAYPTCFVCGTQRKHHDGLRIFAGKLAEANGVTAPWLPHAELGDATGKVRAEFIWSALDCPGYFASVTPGHTALLGELAVHIHRRVHADEPCVIVGWPILIEGRKHKVGTALYDESGEQCALGVATWVETAAHKMQSSE